MLDSSPRPRSTQSVELTKRSNNGRERGGEQVDRPSPPDDVNEFRSAAAASEAQAFAASTRKRDRTSRRKVGIDDFELIRVLGKGCAGKVLLVRKKERSGSGAGPLLALVRSSSLRPVGAHLLPSLTPNAFLPAQKTIVKRHVLAHQELQHTLTEQAVLRRMSRDVKNPFVVHLHYSFHDSEVREVLPLNLETPQAPDLLAFAVRRTCSSSWTFIPVRHAYSAVAVLFVADAPSLCAEPAGGDLATQLARWGKFGRDRARFYAAEIVSLVDWSSEPSQLKRLILLFCANPQVEGVQGLHAAGKILLPRSESRRVPNLTLPCSPARRHLPRPQAREHPPRRRRPPRLD